MLKIDCATVENARTKKRKQNPKFGKQNFKNFTRFGFKQFKKGWNTVLLYLKTRQRRTFKLARVQFCIKRSFSYTTEKKQQDGGVHRYRTCLKVAPQVPLLNSYFTCKNHTKPGRTLSEISARKLIETVESFRCSIL